MPDTPRARTGARQARSPLPKAAARPAQEQLERLTAAWSAPSLKAIALAVHPGLRRTIARYDPSARTIALRADAVGSPRFEAVLVYEAAHAVLLPNKGRRLNGGPMTRPLRLEGAKLVPAAALLFNNAGECPVT